MADRNAPAQFTFDQWRVEFNNLATDVGDISNLPSIINGNAVTDIVESIQQLESAFSTVLYPNVIDFDDSTGVDSERIKLGIDDDLQIFHDGSNSIITHSGAGELSFTSNNIELTFPTTAGTISTEGFSVAMGVALG